MRKAKAPAAPRRSARGADESEAAAPVLSGMAAEPVAEPVGRTDEAERVERVAEETVPLWLAEGETVALAWAEEMALEMTMESEEAADEADEALEAMTEETE